MKDATIIIQTIIISVVFFILLYFISTLGMTSMDPTIIILALVPFVVWLIVSGKLKEVKGPGGISLTLKDQVQKTVTPESSDEPLAVDPAVIQVKGDSTLLDRFAKIPATTLSLEIGKTGYYYQEAISQYIEYLSLNPDFKYVLFADNKNHFKGLMKVQEFKTFLDTEDVVPLIENAEILNHPRMSKNTVKDTDSNKNALNEMEALNVNMLAVTNKSGHFIGVVTQEEIVRKILTNVLRYI